MNRSAFVYAVGGAGAAGLVLPQGARSATSPNMMQGRSARRTVAVLLGEYAVFLDWAGAAEVFFSAGYNSSSTIDEFRIVTVGKSTRPLNLQVLGTYTPQFSVQNAPEANVIIVPGSMPRDLASDAATVAWVRRELSKGAIVLSVCTGAMVLAAMHLLDGLTVTTSHSALDLLAKAAPNSTIVRNELFVDNGQIVMASGTITGIDAALHIVARLVGEQRAADEREYLEYEWRNS